MMTIFGKKLSSYLQFQKWILVLIVLAFAIRLGFSARWASLNVVGLLGLLYYAIAVPLRRFGSYKDLLVLLFIQIAVTHVLIAFGIVLGIVSGSDNMFTQPEFAGGGDGKTWFHVGLHIIVIAMLPFISWLVGAPILWITRKLKPAAGAIPGR
jgi:hypothetical protein